MSATHNITLDITKQRLRLDQSVHVRVGDASSQVVECQLTKAGAAYTPPSGSTAKIEVLKADNTWSVSNATISGSTVSATLPTQAISAPGECKRAYFRLISGSAEDTTEDFYLAVYANATDEAIESKPYSDQFEELLKASDAGLANAVNTVEGLNQEIHDFEEKGTGTWSPGYLNRVTGAYNGSSETYNISRKAMRDFMTVKRGTTVFCDEGYKFYVCLYGVDSGFVSATPDFITYGTTYIVENDCRIRLCAGKEDNSEITAEEAAQALTVMSVSSSLKDEVEKSKSVLWQQFYETPELGYWVSYRINNDGSATADTKRLTNSVASAVTKDGVAASPIQPGDYAMCDGAYDMAVVVYNDPSLLQENFEGFVQNADGLWFSGGELVRLDDYVGKYARLVVRKVGAESSNISADSITVGQHAKLIRGDFARQRELEQRLKALPVMMDGAYFLNESSSAPNWTGGYINPSSGAYNGSSAIWNAQRKATKTSIKALKGSYVHCDEGYKFYVTENRDGAYYGSFPATSVSNGPWFGHHDVYIAEADASLRVTAAKIDSSEITSEEALEHIHIYAYEDTAVNKISEGESTTGIIELNSDVKPIIVQAKRRLNTSEFPYDSLPKIATLLHFSDPHNMGSGNYTRLQSFKDYYSAYIDDAICTGDLVNARYSDGIPNHIAETDGSILTCTGNHDSLATESGTSIWTDVVSQQQLYDLLVSPFASNWGENVSVVEGHPYYYKDYPDCALRLVSVDTNIWDNSEQAAQISWFEGILDDARSKGYAVVVAGHYPPNHLMKVKCNFTSVTRGSDDGSSLASKYAWGTHGPEFMSAVDSFIEAGGNFACWLGGHTHFDMVCYDRDYPNQLFVVVTTAKVQLTYQDCNRIVGDKSQDAFNLISVDTTSKYVKLIRVGQDRDLYLRHMGTLVLDYSTSPATVVYSD